MGISSPSLQAKEQTEIESLSVGKNLISISHSWEIKWLDPCLLACLLAGTSPFERWIDNWLRILSFEGRGGF